jgi:hypothetical protein
MVNSIINEIMCDKLEHGVATQKNSATTRVIVGTLKLGYPLLLYKDQAMTRPSLGRLLWASNSA